MSATILFKFGFNPVKYIRHTRLLSSTKIVELFRFLVIPFCTKSIGCKKTVELTLPYITRIDRPDKRKSWKQAFCSVVGLGPKKLSHTAVLKNLNVLIAQSLLLFIVWKKSLNPWTTKDTEQTGNGRNDSDCTFLCNISGIVTNNHGLLPCFQPSLWLPVSVNVAR